MQSLITVAQHSGILTYTRRTKCRIWRLYALTGQRSCWVIKHHWPCTYIHRQNL